MDKPLSKHLWPDSWYLPFLTTLQATGNVSEAARAGGVSRTHAYVVRARFPRFRHAWDEAVESAVDTLEAEARRRALNGSDFLLWRMLSSLRRRVYGDKVEVDVNIRQKAQALATQYNLDIDDVLSEVDNILNGVDVVELNAGRDDVEESSETEAV